MSTVGGPKLAGIGPGPTSNLVLCMDAHDAGSYPGEPTSNVFKHQADGYPVGWWGDGGNQAGLTKSTYNVYDPSLQYNGYPTVLWTPGTSRNCYLNGTADIPNNVLSTAWTFSCYMKYEDSAAITSMSVYLYYSSSDGSAAGTIVDAGNGWYRVSRSRTGSSDYISLAGFTGITAGKKIYLSGAQLEKKTYPTPFVTGFTYSGEVYDGRPVTTNLMIHGDVGTGQTFSDSSPSKHTITANGNVTHSDAQSKFSGGSFYFDGSSDELTIPTSDDWDFGTGDFTVDFWTYIESGAQDDTFFSTLPTGGSPVGINLSLRETEPFSLGCYSSSGYIGGGSSGQNYTSRVIYEEIWYHIAVVRIDGVFYTYVDGTLVGTDARYPSLNVDTDQPFYMGRFYTNGTGYYLHGYMDEMRVTKGTALWRGAFTPPTRRNRSAPVVDLSGTNNGGNFATKDMTDVATYRDGQVIEPVGSAVWDFDGTDDSINGGKGCRVGNTRRKSIEAWVRGVTSGTKTLLFMGDHANNYKWQWTTIGGGQYMTGSGYGTRYYWPDGYLTAAGWHHWVDVVDEDQGAGDRVKRYVDGVLLTPNALTTDTGDSFYDGTDMYVDIGMAELGSGPYGLFDGEIGAVRLYRTALSHNQVKQNFNAQRSRFEV